MLWFDFAAAGAAMALVMFYFATRKLRQKVA